VLAAAMARAAAEAERIRAWDGVLVTPRGVALDDDLDGLYRRLLARTPAEADDPMVEHRAARELLAELRGRGDLLELAQEDGHIVAELEALAAARVCTPVLGLHVQDELLRRYVPGSDLLKSFLRERDREAFENVPLNPAAQYDHAPQILRFLCGDRRHGPELVRTLNEAAHVRAGGQARYEFVDTGDPEQLALVQIRVSFSPSQINLYPPCRNAYLQRSRDLALEQMHTELVGRFLPEPGVPASDVDAQVALVKAFAINALTLDDDSMQLLYGTCSGECEPVDAHQQVFRRFDIRVELATRFYADWREHGPQPLRERVLLLGALQKDKMHAAPALSRQVANMVEPTPIQQILEELAFYGRNTVPEATWWGWKQP
jgi:hypothetical protein